MNFMFKIGKLITYIRIQAVLNIMLQLLKVLRDMKVKKKKKSTNLPFVIIVLSMVLIGISVCICYFKTTGRLG